jgi:DNA-3-methyladenine glycosylase II
VHPTFSEESLPALCKQLAKKDSHLKSIIDQYGHPPFWSRKASFETLIHIILEQQVSLASAKSALNKLKEKIGAVTPKKILSLTDAELKARNLAEAIESGELSVKKLQHLPDDEIRETLTRIKGIGNWTVDVFLMMVLHRTDLFPTGDIALMNSFKHIKQLPANKSKEEILAYAEQWRPYRTLAAFLLWHAYIKRKNITY